MAVRSPTLVFVAVAMLATSAILWATKEHPAQSDAPVAVKPIGSKLDLHGTTERFTASPVGSPTWILTSAYLGNHTRIFIPDDGPVDGLTILVTAPHLIRMGGLDADGQLVFRGPDPAHADRELAIVAIR